MGPGRKGSRPLLLSHRLSMRSPVYPGMAPFIVARLRAMGEGASSNASLLVMGGHVGTHADAPLHFDEKGCSLSDFQVEELLFERAVLLDIPKREGELISREELRRREREWAGASFLMLRTGFQRFRSERPEVYAGRGPCLSAAAAEYLAGFYPRLRGLGIDAISISSPLHREEGRRAHRVLLGGRRFLIVEDMDLADKPKRYRRLIVAPLLAEGLDGAPCLVLGFP